MEICEENRFCIKNQQNFLLRIENENLVKRQEAAAKLAKMRLFQKSNQFKTKKQNENGRIAAIEKESEKPAFGKLGVSAEVSEIIAYDKFSGANNQVANPMKNSEHSTKDNGFIIGYNSAGSEYGKRSSHISNGKGGVSLPAAHSSSNTESKLDKSPDPNATGHCNIANTINTDVNLPKATVIQPTILSTSPLQTSLVSAAEARSISTPTSQYFNEGFKVASERPTSSHFINFSDFESDSTPFDAVAIQSVNDKEELEQIFRVGVASSQPQINTTNVGNGGGGGQNGYGLSQHFQYYHMYNHASQNQPANVSNKSNRIAVTTQPENYYNHILSQDSNHINANFLQNAAARATNTTTNATTANFDPKGHGVAPNGFSHELGGTAAESFPYQKAQPIQQNMTSENFSLTRMTTDYNSFSAYLPFTTKTYTSPLNSNSATYEGNGLSVATAVGHAKIDGQPLNNQSFSTTHGPVRNSSNVYRIPSAQSQRSSSLMPSAPRSLSPRSESNLNRHTDNVLNVLHTAPQSATTSTSLLSSAKKDFNHGANKDVGGLLATATGSIPFEQGLVVSAGHCNNHNHQPTSMPQSKVPVVSGEPSEGTPSISSGSGGGLGGMKSAKSVGDLSSLMCEDVHFNSWTNSNNSSNSHSHTADFNIYYPMSNHLAIKR